jgi:hypothetical protein
MPKAVRSRNLIAAHTTSISAQNKSPKTMASKSRSVWKNTTWKWAPALAKTRDQKTLVDATNKVQTAKALV